MSDDRYYTLDEARVVLAREACAIAGHDLEIVMDGTATPVAVICVRGCGEAWEVRPQDDGEAA